MKDLENEVNKAYKKAGVKPMTDEEVDKAIEEANEKMKNGECVFTSHDEVKEILANRKRKRPLPVGLNDEQHSYLESKGNKAEYMRNLLIIDMANKDNK